MKYDSSMESKQKPDAYQNFASSLARVLRVSHAELKERLEAEKKAKKRKRGAKRS